MSFSSRTKAIIGIHQLATAHPVPNQRIHGAPCFCVRYDDNIIPVHLPRHGGYFRFELEVPVKGKRKEKCFAVQVLLLENVIHCAKFKITKLAKRCTVSSQSIRLIPRLIRKINRENLRHAETSRLIHDFSIEKLIGLC